MSTGISRNRVMAPIRLYRVNAHGRPGGLATLTPQGHGRFDVDLRVSPERFWLAGENRGLFDDLPYFLEDMVPSGWLGRSVAAQLGAPFPDDLRQWSAAHRLTYLLEHPCAAHMPGDLVLGDQALVRAQRAPAVLTVRHYSGLANGRGDDDRQALVGGEHPKFTAYTEHAGHVIVKFSPREDGAIATRWRDILVAEHLAAETLREAGLPATASQIYEQNGRCFLEMTRFDRVGTHGRLPMLSLTQLDAEFVGLGSDWAGVMQSLAEQGLVDREDYERTLQYQWFGQWMANTDMHLGNLSLAPDPAAGRFRLLPAYDMAPMRFAPERGELPPVTLPRPPVRLPQYAEQWERMRQLAATYWTRVREDPRISEDFGQIARRALDAVGDPTPITSTSPTPGRL